MKKYIVLGQVPTKLPFYLSVYANNLEDAINHSLGEMSRRSGVDPKEIVVEKAIEEEELIDAAGDDYYDPNSEFHNIKGSDPGGEGTPRVGGIEI